MLYVLPMANFFDSVLEWFEQVGTFLTNIATAPFQLFNAFLNLGSWFTSIQTAFNNYIGSLGVNPLSSLVLLVLACLAVFCFVDLLVELL